LCSACSLVFACHQIETKRTNDRSGSKWKKESLKDNFNCFHLIAGKSWKKSVVWHKALREEKPIETKQSFIINIHLLSTYMACNTAKTYYKYFLLFQLFATKKNTIQTKAIKRQ
jgi:hypothetical protein